MANVRGLIDRLRRLEQSQVSPWTRFFGTPEQFEADIQAGIEAGAYDRRDMPSVISSVKRWCSSGMWR